MHRSSRHHEILAVLQTQPLVTVNELTSHLGASEATIRRDISELAERGAVRRVHGGAERVDDSPASLHGPPLNIAQTQQIAEKRAIGRAAAALCRSGDALNLNGGSTTAMMARFLPPQGLHVLTNALPIADYLIRHTDNRIAMPGGEVFREQNIVLSPFDQDSAIRFRADRVFVGAQSIEPSGLMETDFVLIRGVQTLMRQSREVVGLVDSTKFRARGNLVLCALDALDVVITDAGITADDRTMVEDAGVTLHVVEPEIADVSA